MQGNNVDNLIKVPNGKNAPKNPPNMNNASSAGDRSVNNSTKGANFARTTNGTNTAFDKKIIRTFFIAAGVLALILTLSTIIIINAIGFTLYSRISQNSQGESIKITFVGLRTSDGALKSGTLYYTDGRVAKYAVDQAQDGLISLNYADGATFIGILDANFSYSGQGELKLANSMILVGIFNSGTLVSGKITYPDGTVYEGQLQNGEPNGIGVARYSNGDLYEGDFKDSKKNGAGVFTYADSSVYTGNFSHDMREDENATFSIYVGKNNAGEPIFDLYTGTFKADSMCGFGLYKFANGHWYEGEFADNTFNGQGCYFYNSLHFTQGFYMSGSLVE